MQASEQKPKSAQRATPTRCTTTVRASLGQGQGVNSIFSLQHTIGDHGVQRQLQNNAEKSDAVWKRAANHFRHDFSRIPVFPPSRRAIQTKLAISKRGDEQEQEADQVADWVMRKESATEKPLFGAAPPSRSKLFPLAGRPLDGNTREFMEPRFGVDLSKVRVHTNSAAAATAQSLRARAFALESDIVFGAGEYHPETAAGRRLLAHELTHTLQGGAVVVRRSAISDNIQAVWDVTPTMEALLARLSRADVQNAQNDTDIDTKIATLLAGRANDLWLAQRIRQGRLGTTTRARPVEAHFIQGTTTRRALVIAGVHGSERQGIEVARMLLSDLVANQPMYSVIVVPSLFPDNAVRGSREGATPTNRNFPPASEDLAAATAAGRGTAVDASTNKSGKRTRAILPENIMLLKLIERFSPERIISIHGTRRAGAGGVFYDPVHLSAADIARARQYARGLAYMQVTVEDQETFEGQERLRQAEERNFRSKIWEMANRDRAPALAAAAQIDAATRGITGRERRPMLREGETRLSRTERAHRRAHPSVAGNVGPSGNIDTAFWSGSTPGGVSLGGYASQRGISIYTVEPPLNLRTADYPSSLDARVSAAERKIELQAYADAIRTVLLGK